MIKIICKTCKGDKRVKSLGSMTKPCYTCDGNGFTIASPENTESKRVISRTKKHDSQAPDQADA